MDAATTLFLRKGYLGTSMDEIAALAGVSKQTVYTHFADKEQLFTHLVLAISERSDVFIDEMNRVLQVADNLEQDLARIARRYIATVNQPQVRQLRRLVIGEAFRFPEVARAYYERVPERVLTMLASRLQALAEQGVLRVDDPRLAAEHFASLILWRPLDKAMFIDDDGDFSPAELERYADAGVRVFMAAYGKA